MTNLWNWQHKDWPNFQYDNKEIDKFEQEFLYQSGKLSGIISHISNQDKTNFKLNLMSEEALKTSEIEGEYLNRDSIRSSIKYNLNIDKKNKNHRAEEQAISDIIYDLYTSYATPLTHQRLFFWHKILTTGRRDLKNIGSYRTHDDPMQIISGPIHKPKIHFEAAPSKIVKNEMNQFIKWFNNTKLPYLTKAAITHLYFLSIHPFEDGNGRIARLLTDKSLSQSLGYNSLISLSPIISQKKKQYYEELALINHSNQITSWIIYFAQIILTAQKHSYKLIQLTIHKAKIFDQYKNELNHRQIKIIKRLFQNSPEDFKGGLSAKNYISITKTSRATATRDLQDLVEKKILRKEGERKATRYLIPPQ